MGFRFRKLIPRRWWSRALLGLLLLVGLAWALAPKLAAPYVRGKLQAMIASKLSAELRMDGLTYLPPFGVRVWGARLVARDEAGSGEFDLFKVARVDLRLAKLPFGEGPLVIERIDVQQPEMYLVLTKDGLLGSNAFEPPPGVQTQPSDKGSGIPGAKLSDMFELRHFALSGGRVVMEDRTRPGSVPMVWSELSANSEITQTSRSAYNFELKADHKNVAAMTAAGAFDLDALTVSLAKADVEVTVDPGAATSGMPAQIQSVLRENKIAGRLAVAAAAEMQLNNLADATFDVTLRVAEASAQFQKTDIPLQRMNLVVRAHSLSGKPHPQPVRITVEQFEAGGGDFRVAANGKPSVTIDRVAETWTLSDVAAEVDLGTAQSQDAYDLAGNVNLAASGNGPLVPPPGQNFLQASQYQASAKLAGVRGKPPKFAFPLEDVSGSVQLLPGVVTVRGFAARYGGDDWLVRGLRVPIPDDARELKQSFSIEEIDGRLTFNAQPNPTYPGKFDKVVQSLRPIGAFEVGGGSYLRRNRVPTPKGRKWDWYFGVSTDDGSLALTDKQIRLTNVTGDATVSSLLVDITGIQGKVWGGNVTMSGKVVPKKPYPVENGRLSLREVDLAEIGRTFRGDKPDSRLAGRGFLNATLAGALTEVDGKDDGKPSDDSVPAFPLQARGEFEVIKGDLWTLPVLGHVASQTKKKPGATGGGITLGEAAGVFRIADRRVHLDNAAVTSPALGVIGSGSVGFDQSLDLRIVAAPLGDWRDHVKRTRIPFVSDVAGELVGGVQRVLGAATSTLLYQFRVSGTVKDPNLQTVPAPVLTDPVALLLGRMVQEKPKGKLIDSVREPQ